MVLISFIFSYVWLVLCSKHVKLCYRMLHLVEISNSVCASRETRSRPSKLGRDRYFKPLVSTNCPIYYRSNDDDAQEWARIIHVGRCDWQNRWERHPSDDIHQVKQCQNVDQDPAATQFEWSIFRWIPTKFLYRHEEYWRYV